MTIKKYDNVKEVLTAILIGAGVSFFITVFEGLAEFLRLHGEEIFASMLSFSYYVATKYRV